MAGLIAIWLQAPTIAGRIWMPILAASVAGIMVWTPFTYSDSAGKLQVTLLQGNITQDQKFQPGTGVIDALRWYGEQLATVTTPLVVAPETAIPLLPRDLPADYWTSPHHRYSHVWQASPTGRPLIGS